ncbi:MAG: SrfA family protein [Reyranella sp.]|uniref:SrfA family protein n=1 Tax=Reyranella sp. TaxID=1929291 RepID=UPI00272F66E8|nr:SrfA family protein [Reyranella sp.]MDP1961448.1 SrfA family protein [Reyranella sp.]MDP2376198.1 SrfA family protein [Reyranella sp.]
MPGDSTLVVTTRSGVRPLGVRGEPLHNAAPQLRRVVRRRLGDAAADLLADPQPHEDGKAIDWHADWSGAVRPVDALEPARRGEVLAEVERLLAEIRRLGDTLASTGPREDSGLIGLSLKLAASAPSPAFIFLVGDRPVIVAWGYDKEAAAALLPIATPQVLQRRSVLEPTPAPPPPTPSSLPALRPTTAVIPWARALAAALPLLLLVLGGAWLLRGCLPADPALTLVTREGPPAPPAPPAPHDSLPLLKASLSTETAQGRILQVELALVEAELKKRIADCKPPEAPKPPQVAVAPPTPAPAPPAPPKAATPAPPKAVAPAPPAPARRPGDDRLRLPSPTTNMSFLQGCWRTDPFRHERNQPQPGVSSYCFDANGNGQLEWRRGRTACRTRAQGRFEGAVLRLRDADTTCNDGSRWYADQLVCQRGADNVAQCSGSSRGASGPTAWTVNLHKLQ